MLAAAPTHPCAVRHQHVWPYLLFETRRLKGAPPPASLTFVQRLIGLIPFLEEWFGEYVFWEGEEAGEAEEASVNEGARARRSL